MAEDLTEVTPLDAFARAAEKIRCLGLAAQLTLHEAAAILDVSVSTFERLAIPCVPWSARGRRWLWGTICDRAKELELRELRRVAGRA